MSKGDRTKQAILREVAPLFNRRGFFGAAMSDVLDITGMEKGGIYNHFKSKEDLAIQAFDYAVDLLRREFLKATRDKRSAVERLRSVLSVFQAEAKGFPVPGGCPVMNTAIESDDAHPALRARARKAMDEWHVFIRHIVRNGQERREIKPSVDPTAFSTMLLCVMEGAIMQSRLYGTVEAMDTAVRYIDVLLERDVQIRPRTARTRTRRHGGGAS